MEKVSCQKNPNEGDPSHIDAVFEPIIPTQLGGQRIPFSQRARKDIVEKPYDLFTHLMNGLKGHIHQTRSTKEGELKIKAKMKGQRQQE